MLYQQVFDKISCEFCGILHVFVNFVGFCELTWISCLRDGAKISETLTRGILSFCTKGIKTENVGPWKQTCENFISFAL